MLIRNSPTRYGAVAQLLHWGIAAMIVGQFVLGSMAEAAGERGGAAGLMSELALLARHKSFGITIFALAVARLAWRAFSPAPALPAGMGGVERVVARATHYAFYALLFCMPITGWLMSSAANFPVSYFGLFTLPDVVSPDDGLKDTLVQIHHLCAAVLLVLAALHVTAAFKHHLWDRDDVLVRMLPLAWTRTRR